MMLFYRLLNRKSCSILAARARQQKAAAAAALSSLRNYSPSTTVQTTTSRTFSSSTKDKNENNNKKNDSDKTKEKAAQTTTTTTTNMKSKKKRFNDLAFNFVESTVKKAESAAPAATAVDDLKFSRVFNQTTKKSSSKEILSDKTDTILVETAKREKKDEKAKPTSTLVPPSSPKSTVSTETTTSVSGVQVKPGIVESYVVVKKPPSLAAADSTAEKYKRNPDVATRLAKLIDRKDPNAAFKKLNEQPLFKQPKKVLDFQERIQMKLDEKVKAAAAESQMKKSGVNIETFSDDPKKKKQQETNGIKQMKPELLKMLEDLNKTVEFERKEKRFKQKQYNKANTSQSDDIEKLRTQYGAYYTEYNLDEGKGIDIFKSLMITDEQKQQEKEISSITAEESPIWSKYYDNQFAYEIRLPFKNAFDEMIELTNQGKLWRYPIDNEQECDESEANIPFYEHVFLDDYLKEFPDIQEVQDFMTLVLNGLSKNGHLKLSEKREIINWYKEYFQSKMDVIKQSFEAERLEAAYIQSIKKAADESKKQPTQQANTTNAATAAATASSSTKPTKAAIKPKKATVEPNAKASS